jgi:hypothetical protein
VQAMRVRVNIGHSVTEKLLLIRLSGRSSKSIENVTRKEEICFESVPIGSIGLTASIHYLYSTKLQASISQITFETESQLLRIEDEESWPHCFVFMGSCRTFPRRLKVETSHRI